MKNNKKAAIIGGLIAFVVPLLFIGKIISTSKKYSTNEKIMFLLPILGEKYYDELNEDTIYHQVSAFSFKDLNGKKLTNNTFQNDIRLVTFADTTSIHTQIDFFKPILEMFPVSKTADKNYANVYMLQHLVVPQNAGTSIKNPDMENWHIVTRSKFNTLPNAYLITDNIAALVDQDGRIRGLYAMDSTQVKLVITDIQHLLRETYYTNTKRNRRVKFSE